MRLSNNDILALFRIWQFKGLSTMALRHLAYPLTSAEYCYRRLRMLQKAKLLSSITLDAKGINFVWILEKKGFDSIQSEFRFPVENGFRSEHLKHDAFASAIHIGDLIHLSNLDDHIFTEQQLLRVNPQFYPSWVPKDTRRRPDGYWRFPIQNKGYVFSLELELSTKLPEEYENIGNFYDEVSEISQAIWVVESIGQGKYINSKLSKMANHRKPIHSFILLKEFEKLGWQSPFAIGNLAGKSLKNLLNQSISNPYPSPDWKALINFKKYPTTSKSSETNIN